MDFLIFLYPDLASFNTEFRRKRAKVLTKVLTIIHTAKFSLTPQIPQLPQRLTLFQKLYSLGCYHTKGSPEAVDKIGVRH